MDSGPDLDPKTILMELETKSILWTFQSNTTSENIKLIIITIIGHRLPFTFSVLLHRFLSLSFILFSFISLSAVIGLRVFFCSSATLIITAIRPETIWLYLFLREDGVCVCVCDVHIYAQIQLSSFMAHYKL